MSVITISQARQERGRGIPLIDYERIIRHYEQTGEWLDELTERGAGLGQLTVGGESFFRWDNPWLWITGIGLLIIIGRKNVKKIR